jgi:transcriptional/translational regulatory protein YebC/TACO1
MLTLYKTVTCAKLSQNINASARTFYLNIKNAHIKLLAVKAHVIEAAIGDASEQYNTIQYNTIQYETYMAPLTI